MIILPEHQASAQQTPAISRPLCERVEQLASQTQEKLTLHKIARAADAKQDQGPGDSKKYELIQQQVDDLRKEHFIIIISRLKSNSQKEAIQAYQVQLEAAIDERREAIKNIQQKFMNDVRDLKATHRHDVELFEGNFSNQVSRAFDVAQQSCRDGMDSSAVGVQLKHDIQTAKQELISARVVLATDVQKLRELLLSRDLAFNKVLADFRASEQQVRQRMAESLGIN